MAEVPHAACSLHVLRSVDSGAEGPGLLLNYACLLERRVFLCCKVLFQYAHNGEIVHHRIQRGFQLKFRDQGIFTLSSGYSLVAYLDNSIPKFF